MSLINAIKTRQSLTYIEQLIQNDKTLNILTEKDPEYQLTPIMYALKNFRLDIAKLLVKKYKTKLGDDPESKKIIYLSIQQTNNMAKFVIKNIKELNSTYDENDTTILLLAIARGGDINIVKYLIDNGANPLHKNKKLQDAKTIALIGQKYEIYKYLSWIEYDIYQTQQKTANQTKLYLKITKILTRYHYYDQTHYHYHDQKHYHYHHHLESISLSILLEKLIKQKTDIEKQEDEHYLDFQDNYIQYAYQYINFDSIESDDDTNNATYLNKHSSPYHPPTK